MIGRVPRRLDCVRERVHGWPAESTQHCYGFTRRRRPKIDNEAAAAGRDDAVVLREAFAAGPAEPYPHHPACKHASRPNRSRPGLTSAVEPRVGPGTRVHGVRLDFVVVPGTRRPPDNVNDAKLRAGPVAAPPQRADVFALNGEHHG